MMNFLNGQAILPTASALAKLVKKPTTKNNNNNKNIKEKTKYSTTVHRFQAKAYPKELFSAYLSMPEHFCTSHSHKTRYTNF